jgi:hypothetical protein
MRLADVDGAPGLRPAVDVGIQLRGQEDKPLWIVRRTEIDLNGATATIGRSDAVTATSDQDPAWTTAGDISCGDLTIARDGVQEPY